MKKKIIFLLVILLSTSIYAYDYETWSVKYGDDELYSLEYGDLEQGLIFRNEIFLQDNITFSTRSTIGDERISDMIVIKEKLTGSYLWIWIFLLLLLICFIIYKKKKKEKQ
ncbi:MAG: hypothetical protein ACE5RP_00155 [Nitrosopumilus sp.]